MSEADAELRAARLALASLTEGLIVRLLAILGIDVPERM